MAKKLFPKNLALPRTTSYGFLAPCKNLEKTKHTIPKNTWTGRRTNSRTDGGAEGQTDSILWDPCGYIYIHTHTHTWSSCRWQQNVVYVFYVFTVNKVLMHFKILVAFAFILHMYYIYLHLCKATNFYRLFTINFYWSKVTFMIYLKNYIHTYNIYMQSWKECVLPVITTMALCPRAWVATKPLWW